MEFKMQKAEKVEKFEKTEMLITMNFDTKNIIEAISKTNFIPDKKEKEYAFTNIIIKNNNVNFISFNDYMIGAYSFYNSNLDINNNSEIKLCIHQEDIERIYKVLKRNAKHGLTIGVDFENSLTLFSINNITMFVKNNASKRIKEIERIKNYTEGFMIKNKIAIELKKQSLFSSIEQLISLRRKNNSLLFKIDDGNFSISNATGESNLVLLENVDIKNYEICLNGRYIYEILKNNKSEKVNFEFPANKNTNPIMVYCQDDSSKYIVVPINM